MGFMMDYAICPECKQKTLLQSVKVDHCQNEECNYSEGYW